MANGIVSPVNKVVIHMYKIGTGDCFVLKFMKDDAVTFKMLIDCGCWKRKFSEIQPFVEEIKKDVGNEVDVLVITHEHTDHVLGFQAAKTLFTSDFKAKRIWMGWTENDGDEKVQQWKDDHGAKKMALGVAAETLTRRVGEDDFRGQLLGSRHAEHLLSLRERFAGALADFATLHVDGEYKGSLKGMAVVKEEMADEDQVEYFLPGDTIENRPGLEGVRVFVLAPPKLFGEVKQEHGGEGESFEHNKDLEESDLFVRAMNATEGEGPDATLEPFDKSYAQAYGDVADVAGMKGLYELKQRYERDSWRRVDYDWLFTAGQFALRMNSLTNNLSLVLAFEFVDSGKVMLFPGDAEFGSWDSWHRIDWDAKVPGLTTEKLLNRVVFYKVAHHLSHNGTARSVGLDMMTSPQLSAMATLDYGVIPSGWKSTMPNRMILKELLEKTKGRTMIMNTDQLHYDLDDQVPLVDKIEAFCRRMTPEERTAFDNACDDSNEFYTEFVLEV